MASTTRVPTKPGLWWVAFDDSVTVTEIVLVEVGFYVGLTSFAEGAVFRVLDGSGRTGSIKRDFARPIVHPSWEIVLGCRTIATVDAVRLTWLREQKQPKLPVTLGQAA